MPPRASLSYGAPRVVGVANDGERKAGGFPDELYAAAVEHSRLLAALKRLAFTVDADDGCLFNADPSPPRDQVTFVERSPSPDDGVSHCEGAAFSSGLLLALELGADFEAGQGTDITPIERTIVAALVDGRDIVAIAARLNRSAETVRWHVRNLFTKLGVNSQADLARLRALLLPI